MKFYERLSAVLVTITGGILLSSVDWSSFVGLPSTVYIGMIGVLCVIMGSVWFTLSTTDNQ